MKKGILKFYYRYVDDTLVLVKEDQIDKILEAFNLFHNNLRLTVDKFENEDVHFLDLKIINNREVIIYVKNISTGLYINYNSYQPWHNYNSYQPYNHERDYEIFKNCNMFH